MFKNLSSTSRKLQAHFDSLVFSRELVQNADVTFNLAPFPNGSLIGYDGEITCMSYDPIQSLLAVATKSGRITVYGDFTRLPRLSFTIKPAHAINHLLLKVGTSYLLAVDAKDTLHVFDLAEVDERGEPKRLLSHSMRSRVNSIESTPALSHVFIACQDGSVDTFDAERLVSSPYRVKNLWVEQDEILRRSGVPNAPSKKRIPACVEAKSHPLDSNQLLIAYEGGIALYDITQRQTTRVYEYIVLPGAPGGHDDQTEGAFLERRPMVTCMCWRPDGRMFAAGYDDGSFAFWAIEDGDRPVMARTITKEDVNLATSSSLFGDDSDGPNEMPGAFREPVFKMAWSGFSDAGASKGTILTVLGGLMPNDAKGLHCLHLPPFAGPSILYSSNPKQVRDAYKASVKSNYTSIVPTDTTPEDFLLFTRNPYYDQALDPYGILLMLSDDPDLPRLPPHTQRGFAAYSFPPSMGVTPAPMELPIDLNVSGTHAIVCAEAVTLPGHAYRRLKGETVKAEKLPLTGGEPILFNKGPAQPRHTERHHSILTVSHDMNVRIWDYSKNLPRLLDAFNARDGLSDEQLMQYMDGQILVEYVSAAWASTEIALGLTTGDVLFYKFQYARPGHDSLAGGDRASPGPSMSHPSSPHPPSGSRSPFATDDLAYMTRRMNVRTPSSGSHGSPEPNKGHASRLFAKRRDNKQNTSSASQSSPFEVVLQDCTHLSEWNTDSYKPHFSLAPVTNPSESSTITALKLSDAGFLAVAWSSKLTIVDLRGPEVLYSEEDQTRSGRITLLTWAVCSEGEDPERQPRLLVQHESGTVRLFTMTYTLDTWIVSSVVRTLHHDDLRQPISSFVMDPHGNELGLDSSTLDQCLLASEGNHGNHTDYQDDKAHLNTILVVISSSTLSVYANVTAERLARKDFSGSQAVAAQIIYKYSMPVLVVLFADGQCAVFSLPGCDVIRTQHVPYERSLPSISKDGRIIQTLSPSFLNYSTLLPDQLPPKHKGKYHVPGILLPPAPGISLAATASAAAASYITSWFGSETGKKWEPLHLDDILGGPSRPPPRETKATSSTNVKAKNVPETSVKTGWSKTQPAPQSAARDRVKEVEVEYNAFGIPKKRHELTDALEERGERLDFINEHLDNASKASQDFLSQARRTAMLSSAKGAATGVGKGAMYSINKMLS